ncbi:MAG: hypothetical protein OEM24_07870 [Paracoccaceae bacterium]|nr:hypothetical protein [Paracoccaceae bacterium]
MAEVGLIEVRIARIEALFESLDPSPFHERDLDSDATDYILGWARELPQDVDLVIRLHLPEDETARAPAETVAPAVRAFFAYRAGIADRDRREVFRLGRRYLAIGLAVLALCLLAARAAPALLGEGPAADILAEGFLILGWVANWKPLETLLYDWLPLHRQLGLLRRLAVAEVEVRAA